MLRRVEYGDDRDPTVRAFMERIVPVHNAQKITKPLFVVQEPTTRGFLRSKPIRSSRPKKNGGPVWYLLPKDEGHGFRKKQNIDFRFYATVMFLERYLLMDASTRAHR